MSEFQVANWSEVPISDAISEIETGVSVNSENRRRGGSEIGILKTSCISRGGFFPEEHKAVLADEVERVKTPLKARSILMSRMNTPNLVGEVGYVQHQHPGIYLPDRLWMFSGKEGISDTLFLSHLLSSDVFRQKLSDIATGTSGSMKNIPQRSFLQIPIQLPPLPEQKKIAEILSGIDKAISIKRQAIKDLTTTREAICSELMQNGDWSQEETGDLANHMTNGFVGTATPHYRERGVRYLTSKNIRRDRIDPSKMIHISEEFHMANRKSSLMVGDVLMVQSGHIGTTAVVTNDYKDCNCHALILMRFNQERLDPEYASLYFNSTTGKTRLSDIFVGSTVKHVNTGDLRKFKIPVPPLGVQRDIAKRISAIDLLLGKRELQIEKLVILKQAISSDLLSGRKRVSV